VHNLHVPHTKECVNVWALLFLWKWRSVRTENFLGANAHFNWSWRKERRAMNLLKPRVKLLVNQIPQSLTEI